MATLTEDQIDELDDEMRRLNAELATFRRELVEGFAHPARRARCKEVCFRRDQIVALLDEDDE
jgi:hypothetical protein